MQECIHSRLTIKRSLHTCSRSPNYRYFCRIFSSQLNPFKINYSTSKKFHCVAFWCAKSRLADEIFKRTNRIYSSHVPSEGGGDTVISWWDLSLFLSNCGGGGGGVGNLIKFSAVANYVLSRGPAPLHPSTHLSSQVSILVRKLSQLSALRGLTPGI